MIDTITGTGTKTLIDIHIDGDVITASDHHPFWAHNHTDWIDAEDLQPGDLLLSADGTTIPIDSTTTHTDTLTVHNLTIHDIHTFFVGVADRAVLAHNSNCPVFVVDAAGDTVRAVTNNADAPLAMP